MSDSKEYSSNYPINKDSQLSITKGQDTASEFTSISNLHVLPNTKMKALFVLSTLFNAGVLLAALIYGILTKGYILNISYKSDANKVPDYPSVFRMNLIMFLLFLFIILFIEISKLFYAFFGSEVKKLMKFIYMETSYWFIVIKCLFGFNILVCLVHVKDFDFMFITSTIVNSLIILLIAIFYKKIKDKRNIRHNSLFFVSIYLSIILSISVYFTSYNFSEIIYYHISEGNKENAQIIVSVVSFTLQMFISLTLLAHAKDLVFSLCITYFISAYFLSDRFLVEKYSNQEYVSTIVLLILDALTFAYSAYKYRLEAFGLIKDSDVEDVINKMISHKISSVS